MTNRQKRSCLALFDLDGTLTRRDTMFEFIRFAIPTGRQLLGGCIFLLPGMVYRMRGLSSSCFAGWCLRFFFRGWPESRFQELGRAFAQSRLPQLLRSDALNRLRWHRERQHRIVIVSASLSAWIQPWCDTEGYELLASEYEVKEGCLTGCFKGLECSGMEKVSRLRSRLELTEYSPIFAYGNSPDDQAMLELADYSYYRTFGEVPKDYE